MNILILGGTLFLGRHCVEAALARGHAVTLFNRGRSGATLFPQVERLHGDRDGGLDALDGRRWDAVIDTSGYVPRVVRASAEKLASSVEHYTFVSSASVYADLDVDRIDETAPVQRLDDPTTEDVPAHYGALKAACEAAIDEVLPGRALHVRAGLIVGPYDPTGRFEYWVRRIAAGGEVLAPGDPERPVQLVDGRDLAHWIVAMAERRRAGVRNATGPDRPLTMGSLLDACRVGESREAELQWVDESFLEAHDVAPFSGMPLWLPHAARGLLSLDVDRAIADGLCFRPLDETVARTRRWLDDEAASAGARPARLASGAATRAGLDPDRERTLLDAWRAASERASTPASSPPPVRA